MKQNQIQEDREFYLEMIQNLGRVKPLCHYASLITSIVFVAVFLMSQDFMSFASDAIGNWSYLAIAAIVAYPIWKLEMKVLSPLINSTARAFVKGDSIRIVVAMGALTLPFIILTATTSHVGMAETAEQRADGLQMEQLSGLSAALNTNTNTVLAQTEDKLRADRIEQRQTVEAKYLDQLAVVAQKNKLKFADWESSTVAKQNMEKANFEDSVYIKEQMSKALTRFDAETDAKLEALIKQNNKVRSDEQLSKTVLIETGTETVKAAASRTRWIGRWFGWLTVLGVGVSIVASLLIHFLAVTLKLTQKDLAKLLKSKKA